MVQAVICRYLRIDAWARFQDISCWICYRKSATEVSFSLSTSIFSRQCDSALLQSPLTDAIYSYQLSLSLNNKHKPSQAMYV